MKLSRLLPIVFLMAGASARAQFAIAPVAGINASFSYAAINNYLFKSNQVGLKAGLVGEMELAPSLYIQMGAMYASYGFSILNAKLNVNALEVPVSFVYKTGKPGQNRFFVGAGPYLGYQAKTKLSATDLYMVETVTDVSNSMKRIYVGIDVNVGYQIAEGVFTRVSFQPGITQLIKPDQNFTGLYTAQGSISIGYMIGNNKCKTPELSKPNN
jgi:hypothetical protein